MFLGKILNLQHKEKDRLTLIEMSFIVFHEDVNLKKKLWCGLKKSLEHPEHVNISHCINRLFLNEVGRVCF